MNPDVPEPQHPQMNPSEGDNEPQLSQDPVPEADKEEAAERALRADIAAPPFPSRREVHQDSSHRRSFFPSAAGMDKAREMAADILEDAPNPLDVAKERVHAVPWWKWFGAAAVVLAALVSIPLGGWKTVTSAADTVQSTAFGEAVKVGPFSVTVGKAGWFTGIGGFGSFDPEQEYLIMRVTVSESKGKSSIPIRLFEEVLEVHLPTQTSGQPADTPASDSFNAFVDDVLGGSEGPKGMKFVGAVRGTDENQSFVIQPGFTQEFFTVWQRPEGAEMASEVTVRMNSVSERRSTLDDTKTWADPKALTYVDLPVAALRGVE